jgi:hypothetical protein
MRHPAIWLALALLILSAALINYRIGWLKYPVLPTAPGHVWQLTIEAHIKPENGGITAMVALPSEHTGRMLMKEQVSSGSLNFSLVRQGSSRMGTWSGETGGEEQTITYSSVSVVRPQRTPRVQLPTLKPEVPSIGKEEQALVARLVSGWGNLKSKKRFRTAAGAAKGVWGAPLPDERDREAWRVMETKEGRAVSLLSLLRAAGLPAHSVQGFPHAEGIWQHPFTWIEVWTGRKWESVWPETGEIIKDTSRLFPLTSGGASTFDVTRGTLQEVRWSLKRETVSKWNLNFERLKKSAHVLDAWSLFNLPAEFQTTFRVLLLVPMGALMICILRNIIGFPTFGIFMPVLMALAFRGTGLGYGLGLFTGIVLVGYLVRRSIDRLRLLLVPRLSVILTLVILAFTLLALTGSKEGVRSFVAVGLLPMVILAMTVERFFVVIEESGVGVAFRTAAGSAAVAAITYLVLEWEPLQLTFFIYPELLFAVAAAQMLIGRYTGYRLSELIRFRHAGGQG